MSYLFSTGCFLSAAVIDWKQPRQALHSEQHIKKHTPEFPRCDQHELHTDNTLTELERAQTANASSTILYSSVLIFQKKYTESFSSLAALKQ